MNQNTLMKKNSQPTQKEIDQKDETVKRLKAHGYSFREIMTFMGYKSPKSIQNVFNKKNK